MGSASTYRSLAFLLSALVLFGPWLTLLVVAWTLTATFAITPLVVGVLIGSGAALRGASAVEAALSRRLLWVEVQRPQPQRSRGGFWGGAWAVLFDRAIWRTQAYLVLRLTVGFGLVTGLLSLIAAGLFLCALPTFYWSVHGGFDVGAHRVHTLPEALALVPVGVLVLIATSWLVEPLAALWRALSVALLGSSSPAAEKTPKELVRRRGLIAHAIVAATVNLLLILIWALTTRGYFWPVWTLLVLGLALAIHAWAIWVSEHPEIWLDRRLDSPFGIHAGVWGAVLIFLFGVWAVSSQGYFWPVWVLLGALGSVGAHAAVLLRRSPDRVALTQRISALETSRAGAVDVQDAELRRIERDLHDGAQARLVALGMSLGMAEQKLATDDHEAARELLAEARTGAGEALRELRDLARGIHPPVLADRGLDAAVRSLAAASPTNVTVSVMMRERLNPPVESAAYFVVAEALANAGKHSGADRVDVRITRLGDIVSVEVHDDGVGGADPSASGLDGLRRRVEALDGNLAVVSPPGGPTTIRAELPCG